MKHQLCFSLLLSLAAAVAVPQVEEGSKPLINRAELVKKINSGSLLDGARQLERFAFRYPERNRVFGGKGHQDTVNYLFSQLQQAGYDVVKQEQTQPWARSDQNLTVSGNPVKVAGMTYTASTPGGGALTRDIVLVPGVGCVPADYPPTVADKIALVSRGSCTFSDKTASAGASGAAGLLIYNNIGGDFLPGTLLNPTNPIGPYVPVVGIAQADGQAIIAALEQGPVSATLTVSGQLENRVTHNVIATSKSGDRNNVVMVGAHTDSVDEGPGINDDGSGIIGLLAVAKALTSFRLKNAVRFGFWTAEEFGVRGSNFYVENLPADQLAKIRLYLNFDMIASPNYALKIYDGDGSTFPPAAPPGSGEIEALFEEYYEGIGKGHVEAALDGRSDYVIFQDNGIPVGGVFTGAEQIKTPEEAQLFGGQAGVAYDVNYHGPGDTVANLNQTAFLINAKAVAYSVGTYALSTDSLPPKGPPPESVKASVVSAE